MSARRITIEFRSLIKISHPWPYGGEHGSGEGQFKNLHGLLVDERGYVFAADTGNNRIQVFAPINP